MRHFTETDAANTKLLIDSAGTATTLAAGVAPNFELRLTARLNL
jgi:hypothetical protein